jgi:hypothetical protein
MVGVISLLHPLRSEVLSSSHSGLTPALACSVEGVMGLKSYMTLVGSMPFSLFGAFGNNTFSSSSFSSGGNPIFGQPNPMQGFVPSQGVMTRSLLLTRSWKSLAGLVSFARDVDRGKPLPHSVEPWAGFSTYARRVDWGHPQPRSLEYRAGRNPYTRYVIQLW